MEMHVPVFPFLKNARLEIAIAFLLLTVAFQFNAFNTTSDFQFSTWRDGSEALVLGKVFADSHGIPTPHSRMGFLEKGKITSGSNVLAVYAYIDNPDRVMTSHVTDANWNNGLSRFENKFLIDEVDVAKLGYASNEFTPGQEITFHDGSTHKVTEVTRSGPYTTIAFDGNKVSAESIPSPYGVQTSGSKEPVFEPYPQQVGIQAIALSWLYQNSPLANTVRGMQFLMSLAMALVLALLIKEYSLSISPVFAWVFFACMIGSPWIVAIARNLYWAPFLWFLPALAAMFVYRAKNQVIALSGYCLAVFLKCLSGYEYISSVVLLSLLPFMIAPFRSSPNLTFWQALKLCIKVGLVACLGFLLAVILHSYLRADTFAEGISKTLGWDALKYSAFGRLTGAMPESGLRPLGSIIYEYVMLWKTPVMFWGYSQIIFPAMVILALVSLALQFFVRNLNYKRDAALLIFSSLAPLSWIVLMQNHSAIHVHLNYVLWYFGFIPAAVFVILRGLICMVQLFTSSSASSPTGHQPSDR
ncbi:hypothetical protein FEA48_25020 [Pseudomonas nitroreducens]|uniref:Uncharacterized protein n=1 Tax=Pseudomonas nitroreducens TaxID=46680 RepID=A0A5R8ZXB8_PSENT|nr:hypothetical protein [Pseudomonas nitroreducens]TLP70176.1 hypothetical protein FEA48_25020 [Pseudomonas nitroreducens]